MRIKEPLQAIKTLKGHFIMHVAMFIVSFQVETRMYVDPGSVDTKLYTPAQRAQTERGHYEVYIFWFLRWGHLITALLLLASFGLKYH